MQRKDWVLLTIACAPKPVSPVQLQKSLFLLGQNMKAAVGKEFYKFKPYHYGPFDVRVYTDAEELAAAGLVEIQPAFGPWRRYRATEPGLQRAQELRLSAPQAAKYLQDVLQWAQSLSFQELIRAIYTRYPEYHANSVFQG
ncbi:MAG: hypothetical protein KatS3mg081_2382 [Gemmatimonadales bacterium]|nr:MAG: hypothetical protein KatS3mg081_2382 [Gemmatimonadales bacterium]